MPFPAIGNLTSGLVLQGAGGSAQVKLVSFIFDGIIQLLALKLLLSFGAGFVAWQEIPPTALYPLGHLIEHLVFVPCSHSQVPPSPIGYLFSGLVEHGCT